jgi:hypothetical protein
LSPRRGVGLIGSGVFVTDPVGGFPEGQTTPAQPTRPGTLHNLFALPIFAGIPAAALLSTWGFARRRDRAWAWHSAASGILMPVTFGLFGAAFAQTPRLAAWGGLFQRLSIAIGFGWLTVLFARARRGLAGRDR